MKGNRKRGKGLSTIVSTVMLVVIAVIGVSIIAAFIIPLVQEAPEKGGDCFSARDHLELVAGLGDVKTCWNSTSQETILVVRRSADLIEINGFALSLAKSGESRRYDVIKGTDHPNVTTIYYKGFAGDPYTAGPEQILERGSEYTYYINTGSFGPVIGAEIAPILKSGDVCSSTDFVEIEPC